MPVVQLGADVTDERARLGGKAWGIVQMLRLGIPVPPAFVVTTDECTRYHDDGGQVPPDVVAALPDAVAQIEAATGATFARGPRPLLVSVRSGAASSMPGMMDTVLNLGITPDVQTALATLTGDPAFAADVGTRFAAQFAQVVGHPPPQDPWAQLHDAIRAVFGSWRSTRAIAYRKDRGLPDQGGTAVTIQAMVFGNLDEHSGTGVLFSRNPSTGSKEPYGEYLPRGQGEDVVSGSHDPLSLAALADRSAALHDELLSVARRLEQDRADVQDIEFTVESGRLWLLQTRPAKRSAAAAVRLAVQLETEGLISPDEAVGRVTAAQIRALTCDGVEPAVRKRAEVLATGRPAAPGVVVGRVVTDVDEAEERALDGEDVILARATTNPDDVHAMAAVNGIVTEVGGATSHAAVVSRELGTACVVGCGAATVTRLEGRLVTLDADTGEVLAGALATSRPVVEDADLVALERWARAAEDGRVDAGLLDALASRTTKPRAHAQHTTAGSAPGTEEPR